MNRLWLIGIGILLTSSVALAQNPGPDGILGTPDDIVAGEEGEEVEEDDWSRATKTQKGSIDSNMADRVWNSMDEDAWECMRRSSKRSGDDTESAKKINLRGTVVIRFVVMKDGKIERLNTKKDTINDPLFNECAYKVIRDAGWEPLRNTEKVFFTTTWGIQGNPVSFSTGLNHSVSSGILGAGYTNVPNLTTSVPLGVSWILPRVRYLPGMSLNAQTGVSIQWIANNQNATFNRVPRVGDLGLTLGFGNFLPDALYKDNEWSKVSLSGNIGVSAPVSLASRTANEITSISGGASLAYNLSALPGLKDIAETIGAFRISYTPRVGGTIYSQTSGSIPCDAPADYNSAFQGTGDPTTDASIPSRIPRAREVLDNGECRLIGRQGLFGVSQNAGINWRLKKHSVNIGMGIRHTFLRPVAEDSPQGKFTTGQNFVESTSGSVSYTYSLPMSWAKFGRFTPSSNLTAGVRSGQPIYTFDGSSIRFPFWDFISPQNQFSSAFLNLGLNF